MKLLLLTVVEEYQDEVLKLFKKAKIESFSESNIEGFKKASAKLNDLSWFPVVKGGAKSILFFSFTEEEKIDDLFPMIRKFNTELETNNPIKAVVVPIEVYI